MVVSVFLFIFVILRRSFCIGGLCVYYGDRGIGVSLKWCVWVVILIFDMDGGSVVMMVMLVVVCILMEFDVSLFK